jgi:hypothetical protein
MIRQSSDIYKNTASDQLSNLDFNFSVRYVKALCQTKVPKVLLSNQSMPGHYRNKNGRQEMLAVAKPASTKSNVHCSIMCSMREFFYEL